MKEWEALVPDDYARSQWTSLFGTANPKDGVLYVQHFTSAHAAHDWRQAAAGLLVPEHMGYLHRRGISPDRAHVEAAVELADVSANIDALSGHYYRTEDVLFAACVILAHPTLDRDDRAAIIRAQIALTELDRLIDTGTYDRDALALVGGLR